MDRTKGLDEGRNDTDVRRVLLVEDYEPNILIGQTYLEAFGYQVAVAHNGLEGVERFRADDFVAVIMDVEMPVMDGIQATAAMRKEETLRQANRTPIVIVTNSNSDATRRLCELAGADIVRSKPISEDLAPILEELTGAD